MRNSLLKKSGSVCIFISVGFLLLSGCDYDPPEGYTQKHHTYEELAEYAKNIDAEAKVVDSPTDIEENNREYLIYPAVINGMECSVASSSCNIYDNKAGEFAKTYYRMDTDYDYYVVKEALDEYPDLGAIGEDSVSNRFHINDVIVSEIYADDMSSKRLDELFVEYKELCSKINGYSLRKSYWLKINTENDHYYFTEATDEEKQKVHEKMTEDGCIK